MEPSFFLSYWRPWDEHSSFVDSWGDYLRDKSMAEYGADRIGAHIREALREQSYAIEEAANRQIQVTAHASRMQAMAMAKIGAVQVEAINSAAKMIGCQLESTNKELDFLNRRMDIVIEQQRVGLMLQRDIVDLLKIPESEKERQQAITHGIQFFVNASKDPDLYDDALEEFLRAETLRKQDYFVLHRIGCIYMFTEKHLDISKALDYFIRAGKYASVESDPSAIRLANLLTSAINSDYTKQTSDPQSIQLLAGESYEKAALASYVLGNDEQAIEYQKKAVTFSKTPENFFRLGKYLIRFGDKEDAVKQLDNAISNKPEIIDAILSDVDTAGESKVIDFVEEKGRESEMALEDALDILLSKRELLGKDFEKALSDVYSGFHSSFPNQTHIRERYAAWLR